MHRQPLAFTIVLLLAGLAPATAILGFCARMPCCEHAPADALALSAPQSDCCTSITCFESPAAKLAGGSASPALVAAPASFSSLLALDPAQLAAPVPADPSPPQTAQHRLALLSVFLI